MKHHQFLAICRGESFGFLRKKFCWDLSEVFKVGMESIVLGACPNACRECIEDAVAFGIKSKLKPAAERDVCRELKDKAQNHALEVFSKNLESLLLGPPIRDVVIMGIDPGFRTGCKIAICSPSGSVLATEVGAESVLAFYNFPS